MAYTKTPWVNNSTPAINATNLNNMEDGIGDAHVCGNIAYTPFGDIIATNVQAAISELENEKIAKSTLDANSLVKADTDDTPVVLTVAEQTLVGRITAGSIDDLSTTQVRTLIEVDQYADVTDAASVNTAGAVMETDYGAQTIMLATLNNTPVAIGVAIDEIIGRTATGNIDSLTAIEARGILDVAAGATKYPDTGEQAFLDADHTKLNGIEDAADVTDAANVATAGAVMDSDISAAEGFIRKTGVGTYVAIKSYLNATTDPTVNEDSGDGYAVGSRWINVTGDNEYVCLDSTVAAAVWTETTGGGSPDGYDDLYKYLCAQLYGWFGGGNTGSMSDVVDRITLASDTVNAIDRCNLTVARRGLTGFTDNIHGWFGGGYDTGYSNVVDRIMLSDDTTNAIDRCNLSIARQGVSVFTDNIYGWFGGGNTGANSDVVDRITLVSDTVNAVDRCNLSVVRSFLTGSTNNIYGWFGGGSPTSDVIDRITLADDTTNAIDRCNLTVARYGSAGFTDNIHGWFGGGYTTTQVNIIDRITLADDTTNAIDRCDLTVARRYLAGFTNNIYGWFGGGDTGSVSNVIDRMTLATDTTNTIDRCDLTVARSHLAGFTG